jgi:hypothetical protein
LEGCFGRGRGVIEMHVGEVVDIDDALRRLSGGGQRARWGKCRQRQRIRRVDDVSKLSRSRDRRADGTGWRLPQLPGCPACALG